MDIDSCELYHIGSKLNPAADFNTLFNKLKTELKKANYSVVNYEDQANITIVINNPIEVLATKGMVRVEFHKLACALNIVGTEIDSVQKVFEDVLQKLGAIGYEIENLVIIFEILATIIVKMDERPLDILNRNLSLDHNTFSINGIPEWDVMGFRIGGKNEIKNSFFSVTLEPNPINPNSRFKVALQYQARAQKDISEFSKKLTMNILNLITQLKESHVSK